MYVLVIIIRKLMIIAIFNGFVYKNMQANNLFLSFNHILLMFMVFMVIFQLFFIINENQ